MGLKDEILEQPAILQRWLDTQLDQARDVARAIRQREVDYVFLAARGTSDHAGTYAQYLWGSLNHLPVALAAPSLFTMYAGSPRLRHALVVGISQSGQSPDVVRVIREGRRQGAATLAVTNDMGAPLAQAAEFRLDIHAGPEKSVAATKTYTAELMVLAALSAAMLGDESEHLAALWQVPGAVQAALALDGEVERIAAEHRAIAQCVVLGRGYNYATAQEWALKLKELAYVLADPYSAADFQHGPIAIVESGFPVLAVAPTGVVLTDLVALLLRLRDQHGARLLVVSDDARTAALGHTALRLPTALPEWLTPLSCIVPAQLYCYHLARAKGHDPDTPRSIHKVTLTR